MYEGYDLYDVYDVSLFLCIDCDVRSAVGWGRMLNVVSAYDDPNPKAKVKVWHV